METGIRFGDESCANGAGFLPETVSYIVGVEREGVLFCQTFKNQLSGY